MAKLTLTNITSGYGSTTLYNANNALIEAALENTLSLDGTTPNGMTASLDLNSQKIINVLAPNGALDVANKAYVDALLTGTVDSGSAQLRVDLASSANTDGASLIGVEDAAGYYTGTNVETILAELGATTGAAIIGLADSGGYYTGTTVETALAERKPIGIGSVAGYVVTTGTGSAYVADFTPNISLTAGVMIAIVGVTANAITNPTLAVDGLTAKTIVKGDNQALAIGDINGTGHINLLMYTGTVWQLLNPRVASSIGNGTHAGGNTFIETDVGAHATIEAVTTQVTINTWESYGPTGSGATNLMSQITNYPTSAHTAIIRITISAKGATSGDTYATYLYNRVTGSATGTITANQCASARITNRSGSNELVENTTLAYVPVDSSGRFDLRWSSDGTSPTSVINIHFIGYIV